MTLLTGCASVMYGSKQTFTFDTRPSRADVTVYDAHGAAVFQDQTPCEVTLNRTPPVEGRQTYTIVLKKKGFIPVEIPLTAKINKAYAANSLMGGIGLLVDPITGAMWTLVPTGVDPSTLQEHAGFRLHENQMFFSLKEEPAHPAPVAAARAVSTEKLTALVRSANE